MHTHIHNAGQTNIIPQNTTRVFFAFEVKDLLVYSAVIPRFLEKTAKNRPDCRIFAEFLFFVLLFTIKSSKNIIVSHGSPLHTLHEFG